jgi:sensor histidine kinase regulating citrate/malate metabolism
VGIILNNLLDNALEAVTLIPENERYIKLTGEFKENFFLIRAENSFDGVLKRDVDSNIVSRKRQHTDGELHGIGLKSMMSIADKYLGTMDISSENKVFKVRVMLQSTEDDYSLH